MSFKTKIDFFKISSDGALVCVSSNDGVSASVVEAQGQDGSIVAAETYGETAAPSCEYDLAASLENDASADTALALGRVSDEDGKKYVLNSFSITTAAGSAPKVSASGERVNDDATDGCLYIIPSFKLETLHHAQILFNAFTLEGEGCHLTGANYAASCTITKATKEGNCLTFDVSGAKIEASLTIRQCASAAPTVTPGEGWLITAPASESNPDADYPTISMTLTKYLVKA